MDENAFRTEWRLARERDHENGNGAKNQFPETLGLLERPDAAQHHSLALEYALEAGWLPMVIHLLTWEGSQVDFESDPVRQGMNQAAHLGHRECVRALLEDGNIKPWGDDGTVYGCGVLNSAMHSGHIEIMRDLLDDNAGWYSDYEGDHLYCAAEGNHPEIVRECGSLWHRIVIVY